ncbi:MAG: hydrogenase iron-sulfur subunit [Syntrophorhabdaceae bacterium]|nr:hydrogenase iron-sulfur subunit [Syntrophorhabdales bacterium]MBP9560314.1 hydrogenase iron-sulfur subunit [Syntrophorhabdaceae bacterium]
MCSGRVDLSFVLKAFFNGIDGVFIGACHLNECNYITHGNFHAQNMVLLTKRLLEYIGINPERLRIQYMSGAEANVFVESVNDFTKTIKGIGPLGKAEGLDEDKMRAKLAEVMKLVPYIKVVMNEKLAKRLENPEEYENYFTKEEVEKLFTETVSYWIDPAKCQACMTCARRCPVEAIDSKKNMVHIINQDKCIKCGTCFEACPPRFGAVTKIVGVPVPPPIPEDQRTIVRKGKEKEVA